MTRSNGRATQISEPRMATFSPRPRAALPDATDRLVPVCLHFGETYRLSILSTSGHSCNMTMVQPNEVPRDPVLQHPTPLAIG